MPGRFLLGSNQPFVEGNIYANRSSLVLNWLLLTGVDKENFSLREVVKETGVSIGLVQKILHHLSLHGYLKTEGMRTAKRFSVKKPEALLQSWLDYYSIIKKCKMWTYRSGFENRTQLIEALKHSDLHTKTALALHSAAEAHGYKNTNLDTLELYMLDPGITNQLEHTLALEPQERGYQVLLIQPYYKSMLKKNSAPINTSPLLLTFLDLFHFPLRGLEQAEFMASRIPELKRLYKPKTALPRWNH